jgi:uncharacterized cupredoxin-like copper-binding protein
VWRWWRADDEAARGSGADPVVVTVRADKVKFAPEAIRVEAGVPFELRLENADPFEHDLQVDGLEVEVLAGGSSARPGHRDADDGHDGGETLAVHTGAEETMSGVFVASEVGTYDFWCTLPGHKDSGMIGTITVE